MQLSDRIAAVRRVMEAEKLDALVAAASAAHSVGRNDPVFHLSGHRPLGPSLIVVRADGTTRLIAAPAYDAERMRERSRASDFVATDDPVREMQATLRGVAPAAIGTVNLGGMPREIARRLDRALDGAKPVDRPFHAATAAKTDEEIENARESTHIAELGYKHLLEVGRAGMRECDLALELRHYMEDLGADDNFLMFNASPHNHAVQASSTREIAKGDVILAEITPSYRGQFTQICRTVSVGTPSNVLADKYALVVAAMKEGIAAVKPGVPIGEACAAIDKVLSAEGYAQYCKPPYIRRRGHGLGFGSMLPGDVATDNPVVLEPNMFFVVHPNQYIPETGYLLCGEPVRVTAGGHEVVSRKLAELGAIPA
jgi:Xaa-Pro aminopeptidase